MPILHAGYSQDSYTELRLKTFNAAATRPATINFQIKKLFLVENGFHPEWHTLKHTSDFYSDLS